LALGAAARFPTPFFAAGFGLAALAFAASFFGGIVCCLKHFKLANLYTTSTALYDKKEIKNSFVGQTIRGFY
jgi:uncharacterized membrane protein YjjP (DUF1212 family)